MNRSFSWRRWGLALGIAALSPSLVWADRPIVYRSFQSSPSDQAKAVVDVGQTLDGETTSPAEPTTAAEPKTAAESTAITPPQTPSEPIPSVNTKKQAELAEAMKNAYKGVFYDNNFSYLLDPQYNGRYFIGDGFKEIADGKLDIGGEYRSRYHHEHNMRGFGLTGLDRRVPSPKKP